MSNFFSYLNSANEHKGKGKETPVQDKAPKGGKPLTGGYFVFCKDSEGTLRRLIEAIGKHGNGGHSYDIVIDPDRKEEKETFFWDGDGSDRVNEIIAIQEGQGKDNPLVNMCLVTMDSIRDQAEEGSRTIEEGVDAEESLTKEQRLNEIFNNIIHDSNLVLKGFQYEDEEKENLRRAVANIRAYCENCLFGIKSNSPLKEEYKDLTVEEAVSHIKEMCEEALPEKPTQR